MRRKDRDLYDATTREDIYAAAKAYFDNDPTINEAYGEPWFDRTFDFFFNDECETVLAAEVIEDQECADARAAIDNFENWAYSSWH